MSKKEKRDIEYEKNDNIYELAIDSHAHLDRDLDVEKIVSEMSKDGLKKIVLMAGDIKTAKWASEQCKKYKNLYYMVGLHPYDIAEYNKDFVDFLTNLRKVDSKLVGLGEIGLDYKERENLEPKEEQLRVFEEQIKLADKLSLPISIHIREAHEDAIKLLTTNSKYLNNSGIIHCCSATKEEVKIYLDLGFYISFSGSLTYSKKNKPYYLEDTLKSVPLDKLLIETDCPFLCPAPYRGKINEPKYVLVTVEKMAEILDVEVNQLIKLTTQNCERLLKI